MTHLKDPNKKNDSRSEKFGLSNRGLFPNCWKSIYCGGARIGRVSVDISLNEPGMRRFSCYENGQAKRRPLSTTDGT